MHLEALEDRTVLSGGLVGNLVIFGDSLSDTGNAALATGGALPNPALYYQGRFSNSFIWVDTLAKYLGEPAVRPSLAGGLDYAFGGATVAEQSPPAPFNAFPRVAQQVGQYLAGHTPAANDLILVWAGATDFLESFASPTGPINPILSADTLASSLETLANAGARQFVVPNLPPLGEIPFIRGLGIPGLVAGADQWTAAFEAELDADVGTFKSAHPGATVVSLDVAGLVQQIMEPSNPFGFVNTTDAVGPLVPGTDFLAAVTATDPQDYLFYDGGHPTSKAHQLVGLGASAAVFDALGVHHLVVTSTADTVDPMASGLSLREMVNLSDIMHGQQKITFDLGPGPHQITLSGKDLPITQDLAIRGPGADQLTVNGNDASRIFSIGGAAAVTLSGLTIAHGRAAVATAVPSVSIPLITLGGGILNDGGALTVSDVTFADNVATGVLPTLTSSGGAIANLGAGASLTVTNSAFLGNAARGAAAAAGAIANLFGASVTITHSTFTDNVTEGAAIAAGGALANDGGSTLAVDHSAFLDNQAIARLGANPLSIFQGHAVGGAISNSGGAQLTVSQSILVGNVAFGGNGGGPFANGGEGDGGALANANISSFSPPANSTLTVVDDTFVQNVSRGGNGADAASGTGASGGNGVGGAVVNISAELVVINSAFIENEAVGGAGGDGRGAAGGAGGAGGLGRGGAIHNTFAIPVAQTLSVTDSTFIGNQATGGAGGSGGSSGSGGRGGGGEGGAIRFLFGTMAITACTIIGNQANGGAGGTPGAGGLGGTGGVGSGGGIDLGLVGFTATATLSTFTLDHNRATGGDGEEGGNGLGGGIFVASGATVSARGSTITHNRAQGGDGDDGSDGQSIGGGVYSLGTFTFDVTTVIAHNHASNSNDNVFP